MKKLYIIALFGSIILTACGGKDAICECIEVGDQLNKKNHDVLENGITEANAKEVKRLQKLQAKKCADFQKMGGPEMRERKATCK